MGMKNQSSASRIIVAQVYLDQRYSTKWILLKIKRMLGILFLRFLEIPMAPNHVYIFLILNTTLGTL